MWRFYFKMDEDVGPKVAAFCSDYAFLGHLWLLESVSYNSLMTMPSSALLQREMITIFEVVGEQTKSELERKLEDRFMERNFQHAFCFEYPLGEVPKFQLLDEGDSPLVLAAQMATFLLNSMWHKLERPGEPFNQLGAWHDHHLALRTANFMSSCSSLFHVPCVKMSTDEVMEHRFVSAVQMVGEFLVDPLIAQCNFNRYDPISNQPCPIW